MQGEKPTEYVRTFITPAVAANYLLKNETNRRIRQAVVDKYTKEMLAGYWHDGSAENIKISINGSLLDGQHRLLAIIKSGISLWQDVAINLDPEVFKVLDTGASRNACDIFQISGVKNAAVLPSIMQFYCILVKENSSSVTSSTTSSTKKSNSELLDIYYEKEFHWDEVAKKTATWYNKFIKILPPQTIGGMYAAFYDLSPVTAENFIEEMCTGREVTNNTILVLRDKLIADKTSNKKMTSAMKNSLIIKAWNHYRKGKVVKTLSYNPDLEGPQIIK